jgi:hypothetical protein
LVAYNSVVDPHHFAPDPDADPDPTYSVVDLHHFAPDPDLDPDPTCQFDADPDFIWCGS